MCFQTLWPSTVKKRRPKCWVSWARAASVLKTWTSTATATTTAMAMEMARRCRRRRRRWKPMVLLPVKPVRRLLFLASDNAKKKCLMLPRKLWI